MADGASDVRISTSPRSAVSWELAQTSAACCSGESSSPKAAWIPPCAFAELHDCSASFVTSATRAPAASALTAAARPEAPEPTTSTSYACAAVTTWSLTNSWNQRCLSFTHSEAPPDQEGARLRGLSTCRRQRPAAVEAVHRRWWWSSSTTLHRHPHRHRSYHP